MLSVSQSDSLSFKLDSGKNNQNTQQIRKFLRFYLGDSDATPRRRKAQGNAHQDSDRSDLQATNRDLALLEAEIVTEVITISPQELLPVPQMPYCVLGIYSWRSEMLWIVDIENLMGYPPCLQEDADADETLLVMVVQVQGQSMGLVVSRIDSIVEQDLEKFKSSSSEIFSDDIMPFLYGYFTDENNNIVMLIDAEEVFHFFSINSSFSNYS